MHFVYDSSLFHRVEFAVATMIRGKGDYNSRMKIVMQQLRPLRLAAFPEEIRELWTTVLSADSLARVCHSGAPDVMNFGRLTPRQRDAWTDALLRVYACLLQKRAASRSA